MKKLSTIERVRFGAAGVVLKAFGDGNANKFIRSALFGTWEGNESNRLRSRPIKRTAALDTDLNYGTREELLSEARSLEQTYPIAKRIKKKYADYVVGRCKIRWNTGDKNLDEAYKKAWESWMNTCDLSGRHRFPKLMKLCAANSFADGDVFVQQTIVNGFAKINLIEADRVTSSGNFNTDTDSMVGGIGIDPVTKQAQFIRVWNRTIYGTFLNSIEIPSNSYKHLYDTNRIDSLRGVTGYHCVLNALRDLKEIDDAERIKTKRNSKLALIVKTIIGKAPAGEINFSGDAVTPAGSDAPTVETLADGTTWYGFPQEDVKAHESLSPAEGWQNHMEFIVRSISHGVDLPFGVVWSMAGFNKPAVLFELQEAARTIAAFQDQLEDRIIRPLCGWWLSVEIKNGRLPFNPNWFNFSIGRPPYISIDAGRDSASAINENKMALRSLAKWYDETDDYWQDELLQCIKERAFLEQNCKALGVDPNNVRMMTPNGNQVTSSPEAGSKGAEE